RSPSMAGADFFDLSPKARRADHAVFHVERRRPFVQGEDEHRHRDRTVKAVVRHDGDVGAADDLTREIKQGERTVLPAEIARKTQAVELERLELVEDRLKARWKDRFAVLESNALTIDFGGIRRD